MDLTGKRFESTRWLWIAAIWGGIGLFDATQNVFVMRAEGMHHYWVRLFFTLLLAWMPWALATPLVLRLVVARGGRHPVAARDHTRTHIAARGGPPSHAKHAAVSHTTHVSSAHPRRRG